MYWLMIPFIYFRQVYKSIVDIRECNGVLVSIATVVSAWIEFSLLHELCAY